MNSSRERPDRMRDLLLKSAGKESSPEKFQQVMHDPHFTKVTQLWKIKCASFRSNVQFKLEYSFYMLADSSHLFTGEPVFQRNNEICSLCVVLVSENFFIPISFNFINGALLL